MNDQNIAARYEYAKERYAEYGVDTDAAVEKLIGKRISFNAWQLDDVRGFLKLESSGCSGIMATGNYMGVATDAKQLMQDADKVFSLVPGNHKLSLQANMISSGEGKVDLDSIEPENFSGYVDWAKEKNIGLDINPSCAGHPMLSSGFTLSSSDKGIREYWIDHFMRTSRIGEYFGKMLGIKCVTNYWIPDGFKDLPADLYTPRVRLAESLDKIFSVPINRKYSIDTLESKLFGIGIEAYTVGSHEFYMGYAIKNKIPLALDCGHFHISEDVSNKISALMLVCDELLLHITRPMHWDSDHVVLFDDNTRSMMTEVVRGNWLNRIHIGTDYFDASINRIAAGVLGVRNTQKALLVALLEPVKLLQKTEAEGDFTSRLALMDEMKTMPFSDVWDYVCEKENVATGTEWLKEVKRYEKEVLAAR